jgi:Trk K+ transport system NAD-binding subunit
VVSATKFAQIPQTLARAQDPEHGNKQQIQNLDVDAPADMVIRNRLEVADQIELGCGRDALEQIEEAIPPTSTHARSPGKESYDKF